MCVVERAVQPSIASGVLCGVLGQQGGTKRARFLKLRIGGQHPPSKTLVRIHRLLFVCLLILLLVTVSIIIVITTIAIVIINMFRFIDYQYESAFQDRIPNRSLIEPRDAAPTTNRRPGMLYYG